jgi:hypothetical protein
MILFRKSFKITTAKKYVLLRKNRLFIATQTIKLHLSPKKSVYHMSSKRCEPYTLDFRTRPARNHLNDVRKHINAQKITRIRYQFQLNLELNTLLFVTGPVTISCGYTVSRA